MSLVIEDENNFEFKVLNFILEYSFEYKNRFFGNHYPLYSIIVDFSSSYKLQHPKSL